MYLHVFHGSPTFLTDDFVVGASNTAGSCCVDVGSRTLEEASADWPDLFAAQFPKVCAHQMGELRLEASTRIDDEAGAARARYITVSPGQESTYRLKRDEALAFVASTSPVDASYPILAAEASATGVSVGTVAETVLSRAAQWTSLAARIEGLRLGAKKQLRDATTMRGVLAASAAPIVWP